jgi:hypothetical protein
LQRGVGNEFLRKQGLLTLLLSKRCLQYGLRLASQLNGNWALDFLNLRQPRLGLSDISLGLLSGSQQFGRFQFNQDCSRFNGLTFDDRDLAHRTRDLCTEFDPVGALDPTAGDDNLG